jgi:ABC-type transporter Mla subunit MlaD
VSVDLSIAEARSPTSPSEDAPEPAPAEPGTRSAEGALGELHRAEDEFQRFFDESFAGLQSLALELARRQQGVDATTRRQADELRAVTDCRRQFRACLEELQEVQADARDAREETRRVWADIRAAQEQSLRQYTELGAAHAGLLEELGRVRALLEAAFPLSKSQPDANTAGGGQSPPISDRAAAGEVLAPGKPSQPGNGRFPKTHHDRD